MWGGMILVVITGAVHLVAVVLAQPSNAGGSTGDWSTGWEFEPPIRRRQSNGTEWSLLGAMDTGTAAYCAGGASVPDASLYAVSPCERTGSLPAAALHRGSKVLIKQNQNYTAVPLRGLPFCCKSNYTALLPAGVDPVDLDNIARGHFRRVLRSLELTDCKSFYPLRSCTPCLDAYRTWICALAFPLQCSGQRRNDVAKICNEVCLEVQRKCPGSLEFTCPTHDQWNDGSYGAFSVSPATNRSLAAFGSGGCNPMQYNHGPNGLVFSLQAIAASGSAMWLSVSALFVLLS